MRDVATTIERRTFYSFSGEIGTSSLPGITVGEPFQGTLRYDPHAVPLELGQSEARYADPRGLIDARIGGYCVHSAGGVEISFFATPSILRLALSAAPAGRAGSQIQTCRVLLMSACGIGAVSADHLPESLDRAGFDMLSFTLENANYTGFALGKIKALSRIVSRAA
jgi:hypothetical protein